MLRLSRKRYSTSKIKPRFFSKRKKVSLIRVLPNMPRKLKISAMKSNFIG